jgi:hypothetical protein
MGDNQFSSKNALPSAVINSVDGPISLPNQDETNTNKTELANMSDKLDPIQKRITDERTKNNYNWVDFKASPGAVSSNSVGFFSPAEYSLDPSVQMTLLDTKLHTRESCALGAGLKIADARFNEAQQSLPTLANGLAFKVVDGYFNDNVKHFNRAPVLSTGIATDFSSLNTSTNQFSAKTEYYSVEWTGLFKPSTSGWWVFEMTSDDSSLLWVDDIAIERYKTLPIKYRYGPWEWANMSTPGFGNNYNAHGMRRQYLVVNLNTNKKQYFPIRIHYGQRSGGSGFNLRFWGPKSRGYSTNGSNYFYHSKNSDGTLSSTVNIPAQIYYSLVENTVAKNNENNATNKQIFNCYTTQDAPDSTMIDLYKYSYNVLWKAMPSAEVEQMMGGNLNVSNNYATLNKDGNLVIMNGETVVYNVTNINPNKVKYDCNAELKDEDVKNYIFNNRWPEIFHWCRKTADESGWTERFTKWSDLNVWAKKHWKEIGCKNGYVPNPYQNIYYYMTLTNNGQLHIYQYDWTSGGQWRFFSQVFDDSLVNKNITPPEMNEGFANSTSGLPGANPQSPITQPPNAVIVPEFSNINRVWYMYSWFDSRIQNTNNNNNRQCMMSPNGKYKLEMDSTGNLVIKYCILGSSSKMNDSSGKSFTYTNTSSNAYHLYEAIPDPKVGKLFYMETHPTKDDPSSKTTTLEYIPTNSSILKPSKNIRGYDINLNKKMMPEPIQFIDVSDEKGYSKYKNNKIQPTNFMEPRQVGFQTDPELMRYANEREILINGPNVLNPPTDGFRNHSEGFGPMNTRYFKEPFDNGDIVSAQSIAVNQLGPLKSISSQYANNLNQMSANYNSIAANVSQYDSLNKTLSSDPKYDFSGNSIVKPPGILDGAREDIDVMLVQQNTMHIIGSVTAATLLVAALFIGGN